MGCGFLMRPTLQREELGVTPPFAGLEPYLEANTANPQRCMADREIARVYASLQISRMHTNLVVHKLAKLQGESK
jgi:hypothetical protein